MQPILITANWVQTVFKLRLGKRMSDYGYETISIETASAQLGVDISVINRWIGEGYILFVRGSSNPSDALPLTRLTHAALT